MPTPTSPRTAATTAVRRTDHPRRAAGPAAGAATGASWNAGSSPSSSTGARNGKVSPHRGHATRPSAGGAASRTAWLQYGQETRTLMRRPKRVNHKGTKDTKKTETEIAVTQLPIREVGRRGSGGRPVRRP